MRYGQNEPDVDIRGQMEKMQQMFMGKARSLGKPQSKKRSLMELKKSESSKEKEQEDSSNGHRAKKHPRLDNGLQLSGEDKLTKREIISNFPTNHPTNVTAPRERKNYSGSAKIEGRRLHAPQRPNVLRRISQQRISDEGKLIPSHSECLQSQPRRVMPMSAPAPHRRLPVSAMQSYDDMYYGRQLRPQSGMPHGVGMQPGMQVVYMPNSASYGGMQQPMGNFQTGQRQPSQATANGMPTIRAVAEPLTQKNKPVSLAHPVVAQAAVVQPPTHVPQTIAQTAAAQHGSQPVVQPMSQHLHPTSRPVPQLVAQTIPQQPGTMSQPVNQPTMSPMMHSPSIPSQHMMLVRMPMHDQMVQASPMQMQRPLPMGHVGMSPMHGGRTMNLQNGARNVMHVQDDIMAFRAVLPQLQQQLEDVKKQFSSVNIPELDQRMQTLQQTFDTLLENQQRLMAVPQSRTSGVSCHQCKKSNRLTNYCTNINMGRTGRNKKPCRKKYCTRCLTKFYSNIPMPREGSNWTCPACQGICSCASCMRQRVGESKSPSTRVRTMEQHQ